MCHGRGPGTTTHSCGPSASSMQGENNAWNRSLDVPFRALPLHCSTDLGPANKQPRSIEYLLSRVWVPMVSRHFAMMDELQGGKLAPLNGQGTSLPGQGPPYKGDSCILALEIYMGWETPRSRGQTPAHSDSSRPARTPSGTSAPPSGACQVST